MRCGECGCEYIACVQCGKRQHTFYEWNWMEDMNGKLVLARTPYRAAPIKPSLKQKALALLKRFHRQREE